MRRREFLGAAGATGLSAAAASILPGCASMGNGARGKVVVVGGGYGGATAAKYIRMWSDGAIDVTLVEPDESFVSCGGKLPVPARSFRLPFKSTSAAPRNAAIAGPCALNAQASSIVHCSGC